MLILVKPKQVHEVLDVAVKIAATAAVIIASLTVAPSLKLIQAPVVQQRAPLMKMVCKEREIAS